MNSTDKRVKDTIAIIDNDPLNPASWATLLASVSRQNDLLSRKSVEVILDGVTSASQIPELQELPALRQTLSRLSRSYNNAGLIKQVGLIYRDKPELAAIAKAHFERARALGCKDADLDLLINPKANPAEGSGVQTQKSLNVGTKLAKITFRKTGRIDLVQSNESAPEVPKPEKEIHIPREPRRCYLEATAATRQKRFERAFWLLASLQCGGVSKDELWSAWTDLGEACYEAQDFLRSEECYRRACDLMPDLMISHFNWGTALQMVNRLDEALEAYWLAESLEPNHPKVWCNVGSVCFLQNNFGGSVAALRKAVSIRPEYARAWDNLGCALGALGKLDEAFEACFRAVSLQPNFPEAKFKLGIILFTRNRYEEARGMFVEALEKLSLFGYGHAYLSMTLAKLGDIANSRQALAAACRAHQDPEVLGEAWSTFGWALTDKKELIEARMAHQEAVRLCPDNGDYWVNLARAHQALDEHQESRDCFQRAAQLEHSLVAVA